MRLATNERRFSRGLLAALEFTDRAVARALPLRIRLPLLAFPLAGGVGLMIFLLTDVSLGVAVAVVAALGLAVSAALIARLPTLGHRWIVTRFGCGAVAGLLATVAYDAARQIAALLLPATPPPADVWFLFGQSLIDADPHSAAAFIAGAIFHVANGVGFGIGFVVLFPRPTWRLGVLWATGLELVMALLYPSWLRIAALAEFLTVSAVGHLVYGLTLGLVAQNLLRSPAWSRWRPQA